MKKNTKHNKAIEIGNLKNNKGSLLTKVGICLL